MTSPNRIARAYVEVTGDYDKFQKEASTKLNAALKAAAAKGNFNEVGKDLGTAFSKGFDDAVNKEIRVSARDVVHRIGDEVDSNRSRNIISRAFSGLIKFGAGALGAGFAAIFGGAKGVGGFFSSLSAGGSALKSVFDNLTVSGGQALIKLGLMVIVIPHVVSVIFPLIANLTSLLGLLNLLPAAAAFAIGAIIPLVVGFQNFGDALGAIMDGDPEKMAEALGKLAPAARGVAIEFQKLLPAFRQIQQATQQALFGQLTGVLTEVFNTIGQGRIAQGFSNVATALGGMIAAFVKLGSTPAFISLGQSLFGDNSDVGAIARILNVLAPAFSKLAQALANSARSVLPILERLSLQFSGTITRFAEFIDQTVADGRFNAFLESGLQTLGDIKDLAGELLNLFLAIFQGTDDGGERFLQKVTRAVAELTAFFKSPEGQRALEAMLGLAEAFAAALLLAAKAAASVLNFLGYIDRLTGGKGNPLDLTPTSKLGSAQPYADGGVVTSPTFGLVGEAGPEAIVPLNNPGRAQEVMEQAGLLPLASNMMAGAQTLVQVFLGTREIEDILDVRVQRGMNTAARSLVRGVRGA